MNPQSIIETNVDHTVVQINSRQNEITVQIRKSNRSQLIEKKRQQNRFIILEQESINIPVETPVSTAQTKKKDDKKKQEEMEVNNLFQTALIDIHSSTEEGLIRGIKAIKKLVSTTSKNPPIQHIIDCGLVPLIMSLATQSENETLKYDGAWILINLSYGTPKQVMCLIEKGLFKIIQDFLKLPSLELIENAVWSFGNIAAEPELINVSLSSKIIEQIVRVVERVASTTLIQNAGWCFSNFLRNKAKISEERIKIMTPILINAFLLSNDTQEIMFESLWAISYIASHQAAQISLMTENNINRFIETLSLRHQSSRTSTLRIIAGLCSCHKNIDFIFKEKLYYILTDFLCNENSRTKQETLNLIKNAINISEQVTKVFAGTQKFMRELTKLSENSQPKLLILIIEVFRIFASNLPFNTAVSVYASFQIMRSLAMNLINQNTEVVLAVLNTLKSNFLLCDPKQTNVFVQMFNRNGGVKLLQSLLHHDSDDVYDASLHLLEAYYQLQNSIR